MVKRYNWIPGIIISLGISFITSLPRVIRMEEIAFGIATVNISYNFIFCVICWAAHQFLLEQSRAFHIHKVLTAVISIALVGSFTFLLYLIFSLLHLTPFMMPEVAETKRPIVLLLRGFVISGLFYFISYHYYILAEKQKNMLEIAELKQAQMAANLSSLKEQLSPHFLFNTLNTLSSLTYEEPVKNYVSELANVYRYVLQYKDADTATVQQELDFITSYMYIIKARLEDAINLSVNVNEKARNKKIPPLTLQLLLENAIKHNIASSKKPLHISIRNTDQNILEISNNLQSKTSVSSATGIGLDNIMQRYSLLFGKEISIERENGLFTVKLPLV